MLVRPNGDALAKGEILADLRQHSMRLTSVDVNDILIRRKDLLAFSWLMSGVQLLEVASKSKRSSGNWRFCRRKSGGLQFSIFNQRMYLIARRRLRIQHEPRKGCCRYWFAVEFGPLENDGCLLKIQPRIAWVKLAWVSIAQVTEKIDLPLAVGKECRIQFVRVETGHRSAIQSQSSCGQDEVCGLQ